MSGEYYGAEKPKFYDNNYGAISPHSKNEKYEASGPEIRLNDIEEQLEMAEDKCNTLKGQLDYMKQVYGTKRKIRKVSSAQPSLKTDDDSMNLSTSSVSFVSADHKSLPKRQNSNAIGTDNSGAAVKTINNILTGITNSVNRLSELHVQISESPKSNKAGTASNVSPIICNPSEAMLRKSSHQIVDSELTIDKVCASSNVPNKNIFMKKKCREPKGTVRKQTSSQLIKKSIKVDRRMNSNKYAQPLCSTTKRMVSTMKPLDLNFKALAVIKNPKLVEIFHNKEAKSSDSDEFQKSKQSNQDGDHKQINITNKDSDVPVLDLPNEIYQQIPASRSNTRRLCQNVLQDEFYYSQGARRSDICQKNYELPTIASRMKQVAKAYLNTFSFKTMVYKLVGGKLPNEKMSAPRKTIPFCAAISTSPSHNIGINIQQVMNILKNRQPVNGISPTLAHNIGLAAERLNSKPLSTLVTTINSNTCYVKPQQCPLSKCKLNYQYLQDLARSIPEETVEEVECEDQQEDIKTIVITGPSGDMEIKSKNLPQWTADKSENNICTCIPNAGLDINYVCSKVNKKSENIISSQISISQKTKDMPNKGSLKTEKRPHTTQPACATTNNIFEGKEKSLKIVLTHLHDEFESMNKRYEDLSQKAVENDDPEILKKLEALEAELIKKEEEITMVMTLCKEVMALKQQIKTLKQNSSHSSFPNERKDSTTSSNYHDFNNPRAAFHLTKLLKQIQTYQLKYKNGVGV